MSECYWVCVCDSVCVQNQSGFIFIWQTKGLQVVFIVVQLIDETSSGQWSINIAHTKKLNFPIQGTHKVLQFNVPVVFLSLLKDHILCIHDFIPEVWILICQSRVTYKKKCIFVCFCFLFGCFRLSSVSL